MEWICVAKSTDCCYIRTVRCRLFAMASIVSLTSCAIANFNPWMSARMSIRLLHNDGGSDATAWHSKFLAHYLDTAPQQAYGLAFGLRAYITDEILKNACLHCWLWYMKQNRNVHKYQYCEAFLPERDNKEKNDLRCVSKLRISMLIG